MKKLCFGLLLMLPCVALGMENATTERQDSIFSDENKTLVKRTLDEVVEKQAKEIENLEGAVDEAKRDAVKPHVAMILEHVAGRVDLEARLQDAKERAEDLENLTEASEAAVKVLNEMSGKCRRFPQETKEAVAKAVKEAQIKAAASRQTEIDNLLDAHKKENAARRRKLVRTAQAAMAAEGCVFVVLVAALFYVTNSFSLKKNVDAGLTTLRDWVRGPKKTATSEEEKNAALDDEKKVELIAVPATPQK